MIQINNSILNIQILPLRSRMSLENIFELQTLSCDVCLSYIFIILMIILIFSFLWDKSHYTWNKK